MIRGIRVFGLLSSALRHAVTLSEANIRSHASRSARPQRKGALPDPKNPADSAVLNSVACPTSQVFNLSHDSRRDTSSCLSTAPKYGANGAAITLAGRDAGNPFLRATTNMNC